MVAKRLDGLEEPRHQTGGEKTRIGKEGRAPVLSVVMGQGDAIGHLDAEDEAGGHRGGVFAHDVGSRQDWSFTREQ